MVHILTKCIKLIVEKVLARTLRGVTMFPAALNTRSDGVLVALTDKYFLATFERRGNRA